MVPVDHEKQKTKTKKFQELFLLRGCGWCAECRTVVSDTNTGNGGRMTDVPNVDESVVNDVTQGGIMTEVRTDVNVNDGKDDRVANDDSGDSEVLTDVCNDAECTGCTKTEIEARWIK